MIYFCPFCWFSASYTFGHCPHCGKDLAEWEKMDYEERLTISLGHPEAETRHRAAHILGLLKAVKAIPALIQAAQETEDLFLLREIAWALGEIKDPASLAQLLDFLKHPSFLIRNEAVQGLGKMGGKRALEALSMACSDPTESVREAAGKILKTIRI